jgi:hypothetical protein
MRKLLVIGVAIPFFLQTAAFAHRLDEYLEATVVSVESGRVDGSMRLVPGVAVSSAVISSIDTNGDGVLSEAERQAYAQRFLKDVSLSVDGQPLPLRLVSADFPPIDSMKHGVDEIHVDFSAELPRGGASRRLVFENWHERNIAVYLVNSLVPRDKNIQIIAQSRNENQSFYQLDFVQAGGVDHAFRPSLSGFAGAFHLGLRHIAEGTDHLLFLIALLLPSPLLACGSRWGPPATVRRSLVQILRIMTAFTLGHSFTLALAAFGFLTLPSRPVEVLIAVSILLSAIHAFRPLLPGREAAVAAFFGLIHGLAFASALSDLGFSGWYRLVSLLGFNLGIETMQLIVVVAILPSLLLLSRTPAYSLMRIGGAFFAGVASTGCIIERTADVHSVVGVMVNGAAHYAIWIAVGLFLASLNCRLLYDIPNTNHRETSDLFPARQAQCAVNSDNCGGSILN